MQDKAIEIAFFNAHAVADDYNVFSDAANGRLVDSFVSLSGLRAGAKVADLGCGSGVFTFLLGERGYDVSGLDISPKLLDLGRKKWPWISFVEGDVENLPYENGALDGVLLSGIVHHLPDPRRCAAEVFRVLKPGGRFVAFDPNRRNPFMYLYRDQSSPLYSAVGVTANERPVIAAEIVRVFNGAGFRTSTSYLAGLSYNYVASSAARSLLPIYNVIDKWLFRPSFMAPFSPFVLTHGVKP
jgi:ubiquinone/menaquinone biosynthesis C-methylase UbiE